MSIKCVYPWMHYVVNPEGSVRPCCVSDINDDRSFNVKLQSNPLNDSAFQMLRENFEKNQWPKICSQCKIKEENGIKSHRQLVNEKFNHSSVKLKYLDVKFSNKCNLACIMCNPLNSSLLEDAYRKYPELAPNFIQLKLKRYEQNKDIVSHVKESIQNGLEILKVTGGEPFASKEFIEIVNFCVDNNYSQNLELKFTTNASKINFSILDKIKKFKKLDIIVSVDGCDKIYEYIRYGASWKTTYKNINFLKEITDIKFNAVLTSYNVLNLNSLIDLFKDKLYVDVGLKPYDSELNAGFLPDEIKKIAIDRIDNNSVIKYLTNSSYDEKKCKLLKETTLKYDLLRNRNYREHLDSILINYFEKV